MSEVRLYLAHRHRSHWRLPAFRHTTLALAVLAMAGQAQAQQTITVPTADSSGGSTRSDDAAPAAATTPAAPATSVATRTAPATSIPSGTAVPAPAGQSSQQLASKSDFTSNTTTIEKVTVTARRRNEAAQDVPIPITSLNGDKLDKAGIFRLEDLDQKLPSANFLFTNPRQTSLSVRGLGNNPANDALESSVGVYLDNVYLGRPGMANTDLLDVDQVSLQLGPQGTLFGKNTTAGVLNITTKLPTFETEAAGEASYGSYGYTQARAAVSGALIGDELAGRLSVVRSHQEGFLTSAYNGGKYNGFDREGVRGQLLYKPSADFSLRLIGDFSHEESDCCYSIFYSFGPKVKANNVAITKADGTTTVVTAPTTPVDLYPYYATIAGAVTPYIDPNFRTVFGGDSTQSMRVNQGGASAEANWTLQAGYKITSITAYRSFGFEPINEDGISINTTSYAGQGVDDKQFSQELRFASPSGKVFDYVLGAYYFFQNQDNFLYTQYGPDANNFLVAPALNGAPVSPPASLNHLLTDTYQTLSTDSTSAFAQGTWHATDKANVTVGIRETFESKAATIDRTPPELGGQVAATVPRSLAPYSSGPLGQRDYGLSALLSVDYKFTRNVLGYASASRGQKSGGINPTVPPQIAGSNPIQYVSAQDALYISPEKATDLELGLKTTSWHDRVLFNADVYKTLVKDYQATGLLQTSPGVFSQTLQNVGYVRTQGVETQLQVVPVKGLNIDLTASYNDAIYKSFYNAQCPAEVKAVNPAATFCSLTGSQVVGAPRWIVNPSASFNHRLFDDIRGYSLASYAWRSSFFGAPDDSLYSRIPAYGLANFRIGLTGEVGTHAWDASIFANNAFDKHYSPGGLGVTTYYSYSEFAGSPRIIGGTIRFDF